MNWILKEGNHLKLHTYLDEVVVPIRAELKDFYWILTDIEFITYTETPLDSTQDYLFLTNKEFEYVLNGKPQIIWGVIIAVPYSYTVNESEISNVFAENDITWESNRFYIEDSILEIIAFDSSCTIVKFKNELLSEKFKNYFGEDAVKLSEIK